MKEMLLNTINICNMPSGAKIMDSIAGNFHRLSQGLSEFIDNSFSNLEAHADHDGLEKAVKIILEESIDGAEITVMDGGTGIRDLDRAMTLAGIGGDTVLNEHGFGFKQALASVSNGDWMIQTRTAEDAATDQYKEVCSPYDIKGYTASVYRGKGELEAETGTVIRFFCPLRMLQTLRPKTHRKPVRFWGLIDYLEQELGYTYANHLQNGYQIHIVAHRIDGIEKNISVKPLLPEWQTGAVSLPEVSADFGGGPLMVECTYGSIVPSKSNAFCYLGNTRTSGVEVRINGRAIERLGYDRVWGEAIHNSQNKFLAVVDLISDNSAALPATRTAKNGFREGDERLEKLLEWIRSNVEKPRKSVEREEDRLVRLLAEQEAHAPGVLRTSREEFCYNCLDLRVKIDLFVSTEDHVRIYEAKVGTSKSLDLYQLRMYWDGCALDGKPAKEAILIARKHTREVQALVRELNTQCDPAGNCYHFALATWAEKGIESSSVA